MKFGDIADVLRSKNAGPYATTIDIIFNDKQLYELIVEKEIITSEKISQLYTVSKEDININQYDSGQAIKITIPSRASSGSPWDTDLHAAQQHTPVFDISIDQEIDRLEMTEKEKEILKTQ